MDRHFLVVTISNSVTEKESENKHILYVVWLCGYVAMWHKVPSARVYLHVLSQAKSFSADSMFADFVFFLLLVDANLKHPYFPHTLYELAINVTCDTTFRWLLRLI